MSNTQKKEDVKEYAITITDAGKDLFARSTPNGFKVAFEKAVIGSGEDDKGYEVTGGETDLKTREEEINIEHYKPATVTKTREDGTEYQEVVIDFFLDFPGTNKNFWIREIGFFAKDEQNDNQLVLVALWSGPELNQGQKVKNHGVYLELRLHILHEINLDQIVLSNPETDFTQLLRSEWEKYFLKENIIKSMPDNSSMVSSEKKEKVPSMLVIDTLNRKLINLEAKEKYHDYGFVPNAAYALYDNNPDAFKITANKQGKAYNVNAGKFYIVYKEKAYLLELQNLNNINTTKVILTKNGNSFTYNDNENNKSETDINAEFGVDNSVLKEDINTREYKKNDPTEHEKGVFILSIKFDSSDPSRDPLKEISLKLIKEKEFAEPEKLAIKHQKDTISIKLATYNNISSNKILDPDNEGDKSLLNRDDVKSANLKTDIENVDLIDLTKKIKVDLKETAKVKLNPITNYNIIIPDLENEYKWKNYHFEINGNLSSDGSSNLKLDKKDIEGYFFTESKYKEFQKNLYKNPGKYSKDLEQIKIFLDLIDQNEILKFDLMQDQEGGFHLRPYRQMPWYSILGKEIGRVHLELIDKENAKKLFPLSEVCNNTALSKNDYPLYYNWATSKKASKLYITFDNTNANTPNFTTNSGYFQRMVEDDVGRYQEDAFKRHSHKHTDLYPKNQSPRRSDGYGNMKFANGNTGYLRPNNRTTESTGGDETRPKNIGFLPLIKVK